MNNAKSTSGTFTPTNDWLYQHIVEDSRVAVIYGDAAGIVRLWNKGAEEIFGWTAEEALGRSMDLIIPEKHRASHWEGYYRVMKTGVTKYGRNVLAVPALTKGGHRVSIEFNVVLLKAPSGEVVGIAAILQDVTARWERDKALRQRLAAAEAKAQAATH
jgi:PAS domain S-box-containing protein